jgi:hypothetical protein
MKDLACEIVQDLLPSYVDGLTNPVSTEAVQTHLENCPACREGCQRMTQKPAVSTDPARELVQRVMKRHRQRRRRLVLAGVLALLLLLALFVPIPSHTVRSYTGVLRDGSGEKPVTATLELHWKKYLVLEDRCSGSLDVADGTKTLRYDLEGDLPVQLGDGSTVRLLSLDRFIEGYGLSIMGGAGDAELNRLLLRESGETILILGTGEYSPEEVYADLSGIVNFQ